jgi:predicted component of type VI protein secretion system
MQSSFRLVMRLGPSQGKVYPLDKNELFIGRDLSNNIVINDPEISRRHARLFTQGNSFILEDLGSTNGTFVNGQRLMGPNVLRPGDVVTFGERISLAFETSEFDQDATMVNPAAQPSYGSQGPAQAYTPPPSPPPYTPPPQQVVYPPSNQALRPGDSYAQQVPTAYAPEMPAEQRRSPVIWIILIAVLLLICLCVVIFLWIAPKELWCLLPIWPAGACP